MQNTKYYSKWDVNQALDDWTLTTDQRASLRSAEGKQDFFIDANLLGSVRIRFIIED